MGLATMSLVWQAANKDRQDIRESRVKPQKSDMILAFGSGDPYSRPGRNTLPKLPAYFTEPSRI